MENADVELKQESVSDIEQVTRTKVPVLPADIVFSPELCDFLAQVLIRIAREKKNAT